jgi:uncharacterized protein YecE (DUF72 family)
MTTAAASRRETGSLRVGCSGWSYKDWRGIVYPAELPQRRWFEYYQQLFDTVELNSTFYRLPSQATVDGWASAAEPGFVFSVKLGAFGSHRMKLSDAATWLPNHLDRVRRLGHHVGPTLVQLPPRWKRNAARLDEFLTVAPRSIRWAIELREPSWLHDDVFDVLRQHDAALCIHDLLPDHPFQLTTGWTYLRFHGPRALDRPYHGSYGRTRLGAWATKIDHVLDAGRDVYAYFNNDWFGHAVHDASHLRRLLEMSGHRARHDRPGRGGVRSSPRGDGAAGR